jgi:hypothetical protein
MRWVKRGSPERARHDADDVAVAAEGGLRPAAGVGVVDEVVVQQRRGVQQFDGEGDLHADVLVGADEVGGEEGEGGAEPFPAGGDQVLPDRFDEGDVAADDVGDAAFERRQAVGEGGAHRRRGYPDVSLRRARHRISRHGGRRTRV